MPHFMALPDDNIYFGLCVLKSHSGNGFSIPQNDYGVVRPFLRHLMVSPQTIIYILVSVPKSHSGNGFFIP